MEVMDTTMDLCNRVFEDLGDLFDFPLWAELPFPTTIPDDIDGVGTIIDLIGDDRDIRKGDKQSTDKLQSSLGFRQGLTATGVDIELNAERGNLDSDASWAKADEDEEWSLRLGKKLDQFRSSSSCMTMVTEPLSTRRRKSVHSMCHLMDLGHMSIRDGEAKRVLIAVCSIQATGTDNVWNPKRFSWISGSIDPVAIVARVDWLACQSQAWDARRLLLTTELRRVGHLTPEWVTEALQGPVTDTMVVLYYDNAETALRAAMAMQTSHIPEKDVAYAHVIQVTFFDYHYCADSAGRSPVPDSMFHKEQRIGPGGNLRHSPPKLATEGRIASCSSYWSESSAGETSASSGYSFVSGYGAKSSGRKRKRIGGYVCSMETCSMVFDRECDRRKHEKVHSDERAHVCAECGKGFHWPKDLRRHQRRHRVRQDRELLVTGASSPHSEEEDETSLPEFDPLCCDIEFVGDRAPRIPCYSIQ